MSTPEWKSVDLKYGRCVIATSIRLENCKPSGSRLEIEKLLQCSNQAAFEKTTK